MKRWLFSAFAATVVVLAMLWLAGSILHLMPDSPDASTIKPEPKGQLLHMHSTFRPTIGIIAIAYHRGP